MSLLPRLLSFGGLLATSCTVYAPMQPLMPLVRQRGQLEVGANSQPTGRVEATAAYSPLRRAVVTAALTAAPRLGKNNFLVTRQAEVGVGIYQPLGQQWLLSALGGYGQAYCHRGYVDLAFFGPGTYSEYTASYAKYFGQVGLARFTTGGAVGLTYRLAYINFTSLTEASYGELPLPGMLRHELAYFTRAAINEHWQLTYASGVSWSSTPRRDATQGYPTYGRPEYHANRNLQPAFFLSLGLAWLPARKR